MSNGIFTASSLLPMPSTRSKVEYECKFKYELNMQKNFRLNHHIQTAKINRAFLS